MGFGGPGHIIFHDYVFIFGQFKNTKKNILTFFSTNMNLYLKKEFIHGEKKFTFVRLL